MPWIVYILLCDQKTFYIGISDNIKRRLLQHQRGESFFTKKFSDIEIIYTEEFVKRSEAEKREQQLKKWSVAKKKALISGNQDLLMKLSKIREIGDEFNG